MSLRHADALREALIRPLRLGLAFALAGSLAGCATIIHGRSQTVRVATQPPGRTVLYEGASVADGQSVTVHKTYKTPRFTLPGGGEAATRDMEFTPTVWVIGDAALGLFFLIPGLVAGGVDAATGAWRYLDNPQVVNFDAAAGSSAAAPQTEPTAAAAPAARTKPAEAPAPAPKAKQAPAAVKTTLPAQEEGIVSWYEPEWEGQRTASGAPLDPRAMTAAHRTLPLGATVRVSRLDTGRSVVVTINDRGPRSESRILDLSRAPAEQLGLLDVGIAPCRVEVLSLPAR